MELARYSGKRNQFILRLLQITYGVKSHNSVPLYGFGGQPPILLFMRILPAVDVNIVKSHACMVASAFMRSLDSPWIHLTSHFCTAFPKDLLFRDMYRT